MKLFLKIPFDFKNDPIFFLQVILIKKTNKKFDRVGTRNFRFNKLRFSRNPVITILKFCRTM